MLVGKELEGKEPDTLSKARERAVKDPYILEYNIEGKRFTTGEINKAQWLTFQKAWRGRFSVALHKVVKLRAYTVEAI